MSDDQELLQRFPTAQSASSLQGRGRTELVLQRVGVLLLLAAVVLACLGYLGPHSRTTSADGPAGSIELEHTAVTRPGMDSELTVTVTPERPVDELVLEIGQRTLADLGVEQIVPEPSEQVARGSRVVLRFATEGTEPLEVRLAGRTPTMQPPGRTRWSLGWVADGATTNLDATTWVVP